MVRSLFAMAMVAFVYDSGARADEVDDILFVSRAERDKILTYHVNGAITRNSTGPPAHRTTYNFTALGDYARGAFRFDTTSTVADEGAKPAEAVQQIWKDGAVTYQVLGNRTVSITRPDSFGIQPKPFDAKAIGFVNGAELLSYYPIESVWAGFTESSRKRSIVRREKERVQVAMESRWRYANGEVPVLSLLTVDTERASVPIRLSVYEDQTIETFDANAPPTVDVESQWILVGGLWMPAKCTIRDVFSGGTTTVYQFEWKDINDLVEESNFDRHSFSIAEPTPVIDARRSPPVVIEMLGRSDVAATIVRVRRSSAWLAWVLGGTGAALIALLLASRWRRSRAFE